MAIIMDERRFLSEREAREAAQAEADKAQRPWYVFKLYGKIRISQDDPRAAYKVLAEVEPRGLERTGQ